MNKRVLSLVLAMASAQALPAATPAANIDAVVDCADVKDSRERLACFDREVAPLARARSAGTPLVAVAPVAVAPAPAAPVPAPRTPTPATPTVAPAATAPQSSFGQEQLAPKLKQPVPAEEQSLHARITALRKVGSGMFLVTLDNGQTWRHENEYLGAYLREGDAITISKAALGSYRLSRDAGDAKNWIRVNRIR